MVLLQQLAALLLVLLPLRAAVAAEGEPAPDRASQPAPRPGFHLEGDLDRILARTRSAARAARAGSGKLRILHLGDSHVAADLWTMVVRHRLQRALGDGGPGWVSIGRSPRRYAHRDVTTARSDGWTEDWVRKDRWREDGAYGLGGVQVTARGPERWLRLATARRGRHGRRFGSLALYYLEQPTGGGLQLRVDGRRRESRSTAGDRLGLAVLRADLVDGPHKVEVRTSGQGPVTVLGLVAESDRAGVVYDVLGVNGARAASILHWAPELLRAQLVQRRPDLLVLGFGTNEAGDHEDPVAEYEKRLDRVVQRFRDVPGEPADCLLLGPTDRPISDRAAGVMLPNPRCKALAEAQRRVARAQDCAFWDPQAAMGGAASITDWYAAEPRLARGDLVHLTSAGYRRLGRLLADALLEALDAGAQPTGTQAPAP